MNEILFRVILALIFILGAVITYYVIPLLKEKIGNEKLTKYEYWVNVAVEAAEMIFSGEKMGADKKAWVIGFLNDTLNKRKVVITEEQIEVLLESAVKQLNQIKTN